MELSNLRLKAIADMVKDKPIRMADIGCDHAWLSIYMVENKIASYAYACEVNQGPLDNANENITKYHLNDQIETVLSNGLDKLNPNDFDSVFIAGMGGTLMSEILENDLDKLVNKRLYLQPNVNAYGLRKFLLNHHFVIEDESLVKDNGIIYEIIQAKQEEGCVKEDYSLLEEHFGKYNLQRRSDLLKELLQEQLSKIDRMLQSLPKDMPKRQEVLAFQTLILDYLKD